MKSKKTTKDRPLSFYLGLNYPVTFYPDDDGGFTVEIADLPGCITQGDNLKEAAEMIDDARKLWIESTYEDNAPIPMPSTEVEYSGKTMLRMPKYLHERLAEAAKNEETSLNQYIVSLLSERNALRTVELLQSKLDELRQQSQEGQAVVYSAAEEPAPYTESPATA